uniref:No apical meristem-associated C-terminal domain-containing protein n=1 Tax=Nicotiana tabacum TaxID=4097 RepID=A0A1S4BGM8_TOBAC|nr:PREDICTED: uncharacterized protein LOC107808061 [Nicotiana tabacum]
MRLFLYENIKGYLSSFSLMLQNSTCVAVELEETKCSEAPTPDSPLVSSPNLSSFSLNLNEDVASEATSSQRPIRVKKAKLKRKFDEDYVKMIQSDNSRLVEAMEKSSNSRNEASRQKEFKEENKILLTKLNSIDDPNLREFLQQEQKRIIDKRSQQF